MFHRRSLQHVASCLSTSSSSNATVTLSSSVRAFGNAPGRVRPGEFPRENMWTPHGREVSAALVISSMIIVPMWMLIISGEQKNQKTQETIAWAKRYSKDEDPWSRRGGAQDDSSVADHPATAGDAAPAPKVIANASGTGR